MILHPIIDLLKRIVVDLPEYVKPSGGGGVRDLSCITVMTLQYTESDKTSFDAYAPNLGSLYVYEMLLKEVHITGCSSLPNGVSFGLNAQTSRNDEVEVIDINHATVSIGSGGLRYRPHLKTLIADLKITNTNNFLFNCPVLETIFFQNNTTTISFTIANGTALSDASLVSCANGLSDTVSQTLTTSADQKTSINSIVGTVTDGAFTADANGTVTLMDFITNTKGWTVA